MAISSRNLNPLPDVDQLRALLQSMATLDAILCREWEFRYYSFNSRWAPGEQLGSMRDGCGDHLFALFNAAGCFLKGFAHESPMTPYIRRPPGVWPGVLNNLPAEFEECLSEPAFMIENTTFCIWRRYSDEQWQRGQVEFPAKRDPDGSEELLSPLDGRPQTYQTWAEEYYEQAVDLAAVRQIYEHRPLTVELLLRFDRNLSMQDLHADIEEIGYPVSGP